jgi:hypothetical protein
MPAVLLEHDEENMEEAWRGWRVTFATQEIAWGIGIPVICCVYS